MTAEATVGDDTTPARRRPPYDAARLLDVAVAVFNERGYDGTSMEDLARAAGITKSSFYHHVDGKEALLSAACDRALDALFAIRDEPTTNTGRAFDRFEHVLLRTTQTLLAELPYVTLLLRVRGNTPIELAALARRHRLKFATARADRLGHVRFHPGSLWNGFERNAFRFVMVSHWIGITIFLAAFIAALWLPVLIWLAMDKEWAALVAFALLPSALLGVWYRNPLRALLAPLGIYGMFAIVANGLLAALTGRQLEWKGRAL